MFKRQFSLYIAFTLKGEVERTIVCVIRFYEYC